MKKEAKKREVTRNEKEEEEWQRRGGREREPKGEQEWKGQELS